MKLHPGLALVLSTILFCSTSFAQSSPAAPPVERGIIVSGKVIGIGTPPFPGVPPSNRLLTVQVESVSNLPPAVAIKKNDVIAILDEGQGILEVGTRAMFYTNVWILGTGIALRATSHSIPPATAVAASSPALSAQQTADEDDLRNRLSLADIAIVGEVTAVHNPPVAAFASAPRRITEHDPQWKDAVLSVQSWIKGSGPVAHVVVRFPSTRDMAYRSYPKFQEGQKGTFLLHKDQVSVSPFAAFEGTPVPTYTSTSSKDVLDVNAGTKLKALLANQ